MSKIKPANLLFLFSDQHSKHILGSYGNPYVKTPNLDLLAKEGACFRNAYCNSPICAPSRAAMATGNYASRGGFWDNAHAYGGEQASWATRLHEQGFPVTAIGKMHFKDAGPASGFHDQRIPLHIKDGVGDIYGAIRDKEITRLQFRAALEEACEGESDYIRYDRAIARTASDYLRNECASHTKPFVLFVGFVTPHFPLTAPQEYFDLYAGENSIRAPVCFDKASWPRHPVIDDYRRYCGTTDIDKKTARNAIRAYYALCSFLDAQIGIVLDALKETGLDSNTRVIYSSDHGDTMGEHGLYFKSTMYEGSVGIPLIIKGPDIPEGITVDSNASLVDIFPSVLECVGAQPDLPDLSLPGESLWGLAKAGEYRDRAVFSEYYSQGVYTAMYMLRKGDYKYVHYVNERPQLFNLANDPNEQRDLAEIPENALLCEDLEAELRKVVNPDYLEKTSKEAQRMLLERHGGKREFLRNFKPSLYSPIPKLK